MNPNVRAIQPLGQAAIKPATQPDEPQSPEPGSSQGQHRSMERMQGQLDNLQKQRAPQPAPHQSREEAEKQLRQEIGNSNEILARATSVFPFTLFPDTVTIDRGKLTITKRTFFSLAEVMSVRIEDLLHVSANVGPFFGCLKISNRFFDAQKPYEINYLQRDDTLKIKRILQGYIIATQKQIDCSSFATRELADMLNELGKSDQND